MIPKDKIELAMHNKGTDCRGTALYLAGEIPYDCSITSEEIDKIDLPKLSELKNIELGCIIIFREKYNDHIDHMGIITGVNPFLITHRSDPCKPIIVDDDLNVLINQKYSYHIIEYRRCKLMNA